MIPAELARELAPYISPRALWNMDDIGVYMRRSPRIVQGYAARTDFPRAIRIDGGHPLYKAGEVMSWAERWQEKA